jgi:hypothetical protein
MVLHRMNLYIAVAILSLQARRAESSGTLFANPDPCAIICNGFPEACSEAGSHCKKDHACHNLFWEADVDASMPFCRGGSVGCDTSRTVHCVKAVDWLLARGRSAVADKSMSDRLLAMAVSGEDKRIALRSRSNPFVDMWLPLPESFAVAPDAAAIVPAGIRGIRNQRSNCYVIVILQTLLHSIPLRDIILTGDVVDRAVGLVGPLVELKRLMAEMWFAEDKTTPIDIAPFMEAMKQYTTGRCFTGRSGDAEEAFRYISRALMDTGIPELVRIFSTDVHRSTSCRLCGSKDGFDQAHMIVQAVSVPKSDHTVVLEDLIRENSPFAVGSGAHCQSCYQTSGVETTTALVVPPKLLAFSMLRYADGMRPTTKVLTPLELNMTPFVVHNGTPAVYALRGIVFHEVDHFVAQFRHTDTNEWYAANDSRVKLIKSPTLRSPQSYMAIYELV